jgi:NADP-dependent 3-hydroxy acid dehydrogenase YdfG
MSTDIADRRVAVITGGSSGIGAATVRRLAAEGFFTITGARRLQRVEQVAAEVGGIGLELDVRDASSIKRFVHEVDSKAGRIDVLVNNAGLALGLTPVVETPDDYWVGMWEANVLGLLRVTRACIPLLRKAPFGHIVNLGSIAGFEVYKGGAGYTATKHAVRAITRTLRLELNGEPIRITEIAPGMVETEFSLVRFEGDQQKAKETYRGVQPLSAEDIADCIAFAVTRPAHVDIDEMVIRPIAQAAAHQVARKS